MRVRESHNRLKDGRDDGKTPRERAGWQTQSLVMEFGEVVQFIPFRAEARADKFDAKLREGVWLGLDSRTDENIIGTIYGIYRAATIKGVPEDKRLDSAKALAVVGMPWDPRRTSTQTTELECRTRKQQTPRSSPRTQRFRRQWRAGCTSGRRMS